METIVLAGSVAQKPGYGGHTWVFLQYLMGFRKLGWDVLFLDQLEPELCVDSAGTRCPIESSENLRYFLEVMESFELNGSYALLYDQGRHTVGLSRPEILERTARSGLLLNVMGFLSDAEILDRAGKRVFLDIDPGFGQMWQELGLHPMFKGHHDYVTIGENVGRPGCSIPTCGLKWITTPQPIHLDHWEPSVSMTRGFTTVASWRGAYGPVPFQGKTFGLRVHEFRKFAALPALTSERFELALDIHGADSADRNLLETNGWRLANPRIIAGDPWRYRSYIRDSTAEFMVAKNMYVDTRCGWFSDRSICYLASGKPVLTQDTGLQDLYPTGEGLLVFDSLEEAISGVERVSKDYRAHASAARSLACEHFDSEKVLKKLLNKLSIN
jgi:hypothetical protein